MKDEMREYAISDTLTLPPLFSQTSKKESDLVTQGDFTATVSATLELKVSFQIDHSNLLSITQEVTKNLWQLKKYMDIYIAHLQGSINEEEFEDEALKFVRAKNELSIDQIKICSIYLKSLLPDIEIDDIASLLNVDFISIARIMEGKE